MIVSLDKIEADAVSLGIATDIECNRWRANLEQADADGIFFASLCMVLSGGL